MRQSGCRATTVSWLDCRIAAAECSWVVNMVVRVHVQSRRAGAQVWPGELWVERWAEVEKAELNPVMMT